MSFNNVETKMSLATRCVPVQIATWKTYVYCFSAFGVVQTQTAWNADWWISLKNVHVCARVFVCAQVCVWAYERGREISASFDLFNHFGALFWAVSADEKGIQTVFSLCATVAFQSRFICFPSALQYEKKHLIHCLLNWRLVWLTNVYFLLYIECWFYISMKHLNKKKTLLSMCCSR